MVLSARCAGVFTGLDRLRGDPELVDQGLDAPGVGGDHALIGGRGAGRLDGVEARGHHVRRAPLVVADEGIQRGAPGAWRGCEGRPAAQKGTAQGGLCGLAPWAHRRAIVCPGTGEAMGEPHDIPDHAATVGDERCAGAPRGTLRLERRPRVARGAEPVEWACGSRGVGCGLARRNGLPLPRRRQRRERAADADGILAPGGDQGPLGAFEAHGTRWTAEPRAPGGAPRRKGLGRGRTRNARTVGGASRLETHRMVGLRPGDPHQGRQGSG